MDTPRGVSVRITSVQSPVLKNSVLKLAKPDLSYICTGRYLGSNTNKNTRHNFPTFITTTPAPIL
jgi:hypothetical protein